MGAFPQQLLRYFLLLILLVSIVYSFRILNEFDVIDSFDDDEGQQQQQIIDTTWNHPLNRRSLYDPAFSESWSKYFDKKRSLFDPAYNDWANTFKRADE